MIIHSRPGRGLGSLHPAVGTANPRAMVVMRPSLAQASLLLPALWPQRVTAQSPSSPLKAAVTRPVSLLSQVSLGDFCVLPTQRPVGS